MTPLALSPERRAQLAELLGDERRLEAEFPRVAEYLDTAAALPGTGDAEADRTFDLRLLHHMTDGGAEDGNPYWEIVAPSVSERDGRRVVDGGAIEGSARLAYAQTILQAAYAYAIPSPETLGWVSDFCAGRPVIELGAGRGYWAAQLAREGLVADAYDIEPPSRTVNVSFPDAAGQSAVWRDVGDLSEFSARLEQASDAVLLLCWPPGWGNPMASEALIAFERVDGKRLVYVGEPKGGKTGDDAFFDALSERWEQRSTDQRFVSWWNLSDVAQAWVRD
ncbi:hypothetical protein BJ973_009648 [Actinoplanes tereljensis]|uniref:Uncharacterized protein n=1 Tax=Paractinoplanes tereljensis TaxID=571912 RepID=A0A919TQG0_9ACTN|nr:hypothetical protein [Actinoplanes tereljensis]GIF17390.1 hypothetical protein Ate02nite_01200 [Actinoplanes tereljensis]